MTTDNLASLLRTGDHPECECVCCQAARELERLERERAEWAGVAATRNQNIALIAEERDRLRNALIDARSWILDKGNDVDMAPAIEGIERALGCYRTSGATVTRRAPNFSSTGE